MRPKRSEVPSFVRLDGASRINADQTAWIRCSEEQMAARKRKAAFVEPMLLLRADNLPEEMPGNMN
jgi:hypothetical protein